MGKGERAATPLPRRLPRPVVAVAVFLASRVVALATAHGARLIEPQPLTTVLSAWDGGHYLKVVALGYGPELAQGTGPAAQTEHAFFPGYPALIRLVQLVTGLSPVTAGIVVNVSLATVAMVLIWLLARDLTDEGTATRSVVLLSFFPGAFVLAMVYSEGAFLAFAAACLLALHRRRWVPAGLAAAAAGATRPTGLVLAACCAWAAVEAVRRRREWAALLAPALAPVGFAAWSVFLQRRTGNALAWLRSHERGWDQGFDFGAHTAWSVGRFVVDPLGDFNRLVSVVTLVLLVGGLVLLWRWRPPVPLVIYTAGIVFPAVFSSTLTSTPRFVLTAFPLHLAAARRLSGAPFSVAAAVGAGAMVLLMVVATTTLYLTP